MRPKLYAMCGLSFSGKTTLARAIARQTGAESVSLDDINEERGLYGGQGIPVEEWERTSALAIERVGRLFGAGRDVVLDDTLCFRWLRERYAAVADRHGAMFVLVYVSTPLPEIRRAMAENEATSRRPPIRPEVFEEHVRSFEPPTEEERPWVYDRTVPVEEWIVSRMTAANRQIRPARQEDVAPLIELARRSWLSAFAQTAPFPLIAWWVRADRTTSWYEKHWPEMFVLEEDGVLVGVLQPKDSEINGLWVHPGRQRTGAGTLLLRAGEEMIRRAGHRTAWLTCSGFNVTALAFYQSRGYVEIRRTRELHPSGVEVEDVRMERDLGESKALE